MAENVIEHPIPLPQPQDDAAECTGVNSSVASTPSAGESVQPAAPSGEVPVTQPAAPAVNPFAAPDPNEPRLPQCFDSIAHSLPPQVRAKLKTVDVSTAQVVIQTANGRKSDPQPLTWFVDDFAQEAAELVGRYGLLRVTVYEPNKSAWFFGVKVAPPEGVEDKRGEDWRDAFNELVTMQQRFMENVKMELMLRGPGGGGGAVNTDDAFEREMQRMERYMRMFREANSSNDPSQLIEKTMDGMGKVFDGVSRIREKAETFAGGGKEEDVVDQVERFTKIPAVEKAIDHGMQRMFSKSLASRTDATKAGNPAPPKVNPFKTGAA